MLNFTETAAIEWAPLRVNAVAPGWIASSGMDHYGSDMRARIRSLYQHVPLGRLGTESEVSAAIVYLLSPAAAFVSGACLRVDGAVPNARRSSPLAGKGANEPFNAFLLAQKPKVLLLDEPFAGLSIDERRDVHSCLMGIPRDVTMVMIEHNMDVALEFAERITLLHFGEVIVEGTRSDVVNDPRTREVYLGH